MNYYEVYVGGSLGSRSVLTYSSSHIIPNNTLIRVPLRSKTVLGIIKNQLLSQPVEFAVKEIKSVLPYAFSEDFMSFVTLCANNTFNPQSVILDKVLSIWDSFIEKDWLTLSHNLTNKITNSNTLITSKVESNKEYYLIQDILVRIMYIIRSKANLYGYSNQLLLFPELKYINIYYEQLIHMTQNPSQSLLNNLSCTNAEFDMIFKNHRFLITDSSTSRLSRDILIDMQTKQNITVLGTRSALFLPFPQVNSIVLIEESSPFYIQEQNSLYYDAREIAYLRAYASNIGLYYLSSLPSSRLLSQYPKTSINEWLSYNSIKPYITQEVYRA